MRSNSIDLKSRLACAAALLATLLTACGKPVSTPPAAAPPKVSASPVVPMQEVLVPPASQPKAKAPAVSTANEPELSNMKLATQSAKMGVPADLRYQFDGDALAGQPVTLHLAVVPRVAGSNLVVSIKQQPGVEAVKEAMSEQKFSATTPYRQQLSVRRLVDGPQELRVLVTMDLPIGSAFSYFSVPFGAVPAAQKRPADRTE